METTVNPRLRWLPRTAYVMLALGLLAVFIVLSAPFGYRLGLWSYRAGFDILRFMVPLCGYLALLGVLTAIIIAVLDRRWQGTIRRLPPALALSAALITALTWYIPQLYTQPDGNPYPSIHDITTNIENPPRFIAVLPLREGVENGVEYGISRDMTPELLAQLTREAYPDLLEPVVLDVSPNTAFDRVQAAVATLGWEVIAADRESGRIEASETSFWFRFTDDIVIRLTPQADGVRVDARSVSRVGKGDVGINAKRLRRFFEVLDKG